MSIIVITGGNGFIGKHLADHYLKNGDYVYSIDNYNTSVKPGDSYIKPGLTSVSFDLSTPPDDTIKHIIRSADIVYHLASSVGVKYIDNSPRETIRNSMDINNNMFPLFEEFQSRVVFASSSEVYGDTEYASETDTLKIGSPDTLRWGYACGKLMSEFLLKSYTFPSTIARFFNVTGVGQLSSHGMVLPTFVELVNREENIVVYGDGMQYRSFCDIRDAVQMLDIISGSDHVGEIYNIGNPDNTVTIKQLAEQVIMIINKDVQILYKPYDVAFSKDFGEIYKRRPNIDKISKFYHPKFTIRDIIESMK
tara:strand:- start:2569 stop:3492 length:924 start_codon:yes stop_codon:yes gene_type:complete